MRAMITANFAWSDFNASDGTEVPEALKENVKALAAQLEILYAHIGKPFKFTCYRTEQINNKLIDMWLLNGSSPRPSKKSQHLKANAVDLKISGMTGRQIADEIELLISRGEMQDGGLGVYHNRVHYDLRKNRARWNG